MKVGFIGLGNMGEGMVFNLCSKGFEVTVRDVRAEPVLRAQAWGATAAATNHALGQRSDVVCLAVFDDKQIEETVLPFAGDEGVLAGMRPGGVIVLHPTAAPSTVRRIAAIAADRNVAVIDAPMTGGAHVAARAGTLTLMVGGDAAILDKIRPVLAAMASSVFHIGPLGAGCAAKIVNNFLGTSQTLLVKEALRLARAAGIGEAQILDIVNTGGVGSNWSSLNWDRIKTQESTYTTGKAGMVAMSSKDLNLAHRMARELGVATPALDGIVSGALPDAARTGLTDHGLDDRPERLNA